MHLGRNQPFGARKNTCLDGFGRKIFDIYAAQRVYITSGGLANPNRRIQIPGELAGQRPIHQRSSSRSRLHTYATSCRVNMAEDGRLIPRRAKSSATGKELASLVRLYIGSVWSG
jgi:hypothetical protein